ncbi:hypothetical protein ACFQ0D_03515, partial [Micromonospora zhanjiangensis]
AFTGAPGTPVPPRLRAAAAHPMIAVPLQMVGLATLPATVTAATGGTLTTGSALPGLVLTAAGLAVVTMGIRHAIRHSRLAEWTVRPRSTSSHASTVLANRARQEPRRCGPAAGPHRFDAQSRSNSPSFAP